MRSHSTMLPKEEHGIVFNTSEQPSRNHNEEILECGLCGRGFIEQPPIQRKGGAKCGSCIPEIKCSNGGFDSHKNIR